MTVGSATCSSAVEHAVAKSQPSVGPSAVGIIEVIEDRLLPRAVGAGSQLEYRALIMIGAARGVGA